MKNEKAASQGFTASDSHAKVICLANHIEQQSYGVVSPGKLYYFGSAPAPVQTDIAPNSFYM